MIDSTFTWATVTQLSPLRIRLAGDAAALLLTPQTLIDPAALAVGARVRVELTADQRITIHGRTSAFTDILVGSGIGGGVDLDTLTATGQYHQGTNAQATLALHYPLAAIAGLLVVEVGTSGSTAFLRQTYVTRPSSGASRVFSRAKYGANAWSSWAELTDPWSGDARPAFHVKHSTTFTGSGAQADRAMNFNTVLLNQGSYWSTGSFQFAAPVAGVYEFNLGICQATVVGGPEAGIYKNGALVDYLCIAYDDYVTTTGTIRLLLAAGDIIKPYWRNNNGTTVTIDGTRSHFAGHLVSTA